MEMKMRDCKLTVVTPESVGISSAVIRNYVETLQERGVNLHSFLMMRKGKICAEGYCPPYTEDKLQRMYSISKTFTAMAVGLLEEEGKIKRSDRIADYFKEELPPKPHEWLLQMTIEDMLKMATVFTETKHWSGGGPWVKAYLNCPVTHPPGTIFLYDTAASHTLCALVERVSGMPLLEYLRKPLLDPIGFSKDAWCIKGTDGYSWGGSGVMATLRDLAKFAWVLLQGGSFEGKQLLQENFVQKAVTRRIFNDEYTNGCRWNEGYGYQIWILKDGAFALRGMGSQHAICFPQKDFLFCCTADNQGAELYDRLIYEELYRQVLPGLKKEALEENPAEYQALVKTCRQMQLPVTAGEKDSPMAGKIDSVVYTMEENPMGIREFSFSFKGQEGVLECQTERGRKQIPFGLGKQVEYWFPETHYFYEQIDVPSGRSYRAWSCAAWKDEHTLVIRTQTLDAYLGNFTATFSFRGETVGVLFVKTAEFFFQEYHGCGGGRRKP